MKNKILLFTIFIILSYNLSAQDIFKRPYDFTDYPSHIETIKYEVLDINFTEYRVAFKHVYQLYSEYDEAGELMNSPCDCKYPGMQKSPKAGVVLGTYNLVHQKYDKVFTIYNSAYKKSDCYDFETSKIFLEGAKKTFKLYKLDIKNKPTVLNFPTKKGEKKSLTIKNLTFTYTSERADKDYKMMILGKLFVNGKLLFTIEQEDNFAMASGGEIEYVSAIIEGDNLVFLYKFHHYTSMGGETDFETYNFSPVFSISYLSSKK